MSQRQAQQPTPSAQQTRPYQAPRVQDLGAWQAVTLINSVPINPGPANLGGNQSVY